FVLFPLRIASTRLVMALTLVLIGSAFAAKVTRSWNWLKEDEEERPSASWPDLLLSYGRSLSYVSVRTVPLVVVEFGLRCGSRHSSLLSRGLEPALTSWE